MADKSNKTSLGGRMGNRTSGTDDKDLRDQQREEEE
jgi:hypothetical protein